MARNRYDNRTIFTNTLEDYQEWLEGREVNSIQQYGTPFMTQPTAAMRAVINSTFVIWKRGTSFQKLASEHYGDPTYWWVIAWYNFTPTEAHVKYGSSIEIPLSVEQALRVLRG